METTKIFNLYQANIFINLGAAVTGCGISRYKAYIEFKVNDLYNELQQKWDNRTLKA
jgi:hypothetical protein